MNDLPGDVAQLKAELEGLAEERSWCEIRDRVADLDDRTIVADPKVAYQVAEALLHLGHVERALSLVLAAEAEFRARHDHINLLSALNLAGAVQFELGDLTGAEERFSDLLELAGERGDEEMSGRATNNLGAIASLRGEHERALSLFQLSVPSYQKVGFLMGLAQTDHNIGIVYRNLGYWRESERHFRRAQRRARKLGDDRLSSMARVGRAEISYLRGDRVFANVEAMRALKTFAEVGDELGRADALKLLGSIAAAAEEWEAASRYFEEALELARQHANLLLEAEVLEERAELQGATGRAALARADLEAAAAAYRRLGAERRRQQVDEKLDLIGS